MRRLTINKSHQPLSHKGFPLRVTYRNMDYPVHLLQKGIEKGTREIRILVDGIVQPLVKRDNHWR